MADASTPGPGDGGADAPDVGDQRVTEDRGASRTPLPMSQVVGRAVIVLITVLFVVFAIVNRQPVDFSWVFGETQVVQEGGEYVRGGVPLIILLVASFVLGSIVSAGLLRRRRRVRQGRQREDRERKRN